MKAVVTVIGMDKPGIVASVSTVLAENKVNITDISQSYAGEFFTMIMVVDFEQTNVSLKVVAEQLKKAGDKIGVFVSIQHEDVFKTMHRI